jgi:hypothetical protein
MTTRFANARFRGYMSLWLTAALLAAFAVAQGEPSAFSPALTLKSTQQAGSSIEQYPGFRRVGYEEDERQFDREDRARENMAAECMADKGHVYVASPSIYVGPNDAPPTMAPANKNDAHVAALSPEQRERYFMDLYGVPDPYDPETTLTTKESCAGQAFERIPGVFAIGASLRASFEALVDRQRDDSRVRSATARWARCMAGAGHTFATPSEMHGALDETQPGSQSARRAEEAQSRHREICGPELAAVESDVRRAVEEEFVQANRAALDAHRARVASSEEMVQRYQ